MENAETAALVRPRQSVRHCRPAVFHALPMRIARLVIASMACVATVHAMAHVKLARRLSRGTEPTEHAAPLRMIPIPRKNAGVEVATEMAFASSTRAWPAPGLPIVCPTIASTVSVATTFARGRVKLVRMRKREPDTMGYVVRRPVVPIRTTNASMARVTAPECVRRMAAEPPRIASPSHSCRPHEYRCKNVGNTVWSVVPSPFGAVSSR